MSLDDARPIAIPEYRPSILVVDDDRFHRELTKDTIEGLGEIESCGSVAEALAILARRRFDLVVSDLEMPGASGVELLSEIRRHHPSTDFVMVTGNASVDTAIAALREGAADYLRKPVDPDEFRFVVERCLSRRRILAENDRMRVNLETIEATRTLSNCLEPQDVYVTALELALSVLGRRRGGVVFHRSAVLMADGALLRGYDQEATEELSHELAREKPLDFNEFSEVREYRSGALFDALRSSSSDVGSVLAAPLQGKRSESGVLFLPDEGRPFEEGEHERLAIVAQQATAALRNAERYHQAKERAFIDDVTEVYNARYLLEATDRELRRAERYKSALSVLFLDLDRFKLVNDNHGHLVGSQALRQLARVLSECVRQVDTLARYGGDEFTILLVDTDEPASRAVAERIRRMVSETRFEAGPDHTLSLTCSVGVASYPQHGRTREELLDAADKAMYRAKSQGRNRVCSAADLE